MVYGTYYDYNCMLFQVSMKYLTGVSPGPASLSSWCRRSIRKSLGPERIAKGDIDRLTLPTAIKEFLVYR